MTLYSLTITDLKTEAVYRAVFKELMGADEPGTYKPDWHNDVSVDVSASELAKHIQQLSVVAPSVGLGQITIEPFTQPN